MSVPEGPYSYEFLGFRLEPARRVLTNLAGEAITVAPRAFDALVYLVERAGQLVSRAELVERLWPGRVVEDNNLDQAVAKLRRILGNDCIVTVPGRGYQFSAPARRISDEAVGGAVAPEVRVSSEGPTRARAHRLDRRATYVALGLVTAVVIGLYTVPREWRETPHPPAARIAVLPLRSLSQDAEQSFFAEGLHEQILSTLQRVRGLEVISRPTMLQYASMTKTVPEIARELGVDHVLSGSVQRAANIRLSLQLTDAASDTVVWEKVFDRTPADALTLQSEIANAVAGQLAARLIGRTPLPEIAPTKDIEANSLFIQARLARQTLGVTSPIEAVHGVESLLDRALERDPSFALAYLERIQLRASAVDFNYVAAPTAASAMRADLAKVRSLTPDDPMLIAAEALLATVEKDKGRALQLFDAAAAGGLADHPILTARADALFMAGRIDEALALDQRLVSLDPGNTALLDAWSQHSVLARKPIEAIVAADYMTARFPDLKLGPWRRAVTTFLFTGDFRAVERYYEQKAPPGALTEFAAESRYHSFGYFLRMARRFDDLEAHAVATTSDSIRALAVGWVMPLPAGRTPIAEYRGWAHLLNGKRELAREESSTIRDFVAVQTATDANAWYVRSLAAVAHVFAGEDALAIAAAHEALKLAPGPEYARVNVASARSKVAEILAWAGAHDEAVALLEELAVSTPGLSPAQIARDPIFTIPLERNVGYQRLVGRLEAQMAATTLDDVGHR